MVKAGHGIGRVDMYYDCTEKALYNFALIKEGNQLVFRSKAVVLRLVGQKTEEIKPPIVTELYFDIARVKQQIQLLEIQNV